MNITQVFELAAVQRVHKVRNWVDDHTGNKREFPQSRKRGRND
jgi:hypothetical protein